MVVTLSEKEEPGWIFRSLTVDQSSEAKRKKVGFEEGKNNKFSLKYVGFEIAGRCVQKANG